MKYQTWILTASFSIVASAIASIASAAPLNLPREGWVSWSAQAVADAPAWCCYGWQDGSQTPVCKLDNKESGYNNRDDETTDSLRIYARLHEGKVERLRALSVDCPVQTNTPIQNIDVAADDGARWLASLLKPDNDTLAFAGRRLRGDVLAALAAQRSSIAGAAIVNIARKDPRIDQRKEAVFWLAHVRGAEGAQAVTSIMFDDQNAHVREHAAFAITQSKSTTIAEDLIRLGNTDRDRQVRAQAWFWLGQKGVPQAEQAIGAALRNESDERVREQAIFALSQLPDERAVNALIAVAENRNLSAADRKHAIFWLAQEGSDSALAYLDRVVTR